MLIKFVASHGMGVQFAHRSDIEGSMPQPQTEPDGPVCLNYMVTIEGPLSQGSYEMWGQVTSQVCRGTKYYI